MLLIAIPFGLAIGACVGAVGGGGAILALPILVYVLHESVSPASTASLVVVAVAAVVGAASVARHGQVCWRLALTFSAPATLGALLGTLANAAVSAATLVLLFVPVMLGAAVAVAWRGGERGRVEHEAGCPETGDVRILVAGLTVGALTGFFGVGGGFVIVPVLRLRFGLALHRAVATSLAIIFMTSCTALLSHVAAGAQLDVGLTAALALPACAGAIGGTLLGRRLPAARLSKGFAAVVSAVAVWLLVDVLVLGGPPGA